MPNQEPRFQKRAETDPWATPRVYLDGTRAIFAGPGMALTPHKLAVATVIFGLDHSFRLELMQSGQENVARVGLIPPDTLHHLRTEGRMVFLYLDALSDDYEGLDPRVLAAASRDIESIVDDLETDTSQDIAALADMLSNRIELPQHEMIDVRIAAAVRAIDAAPNEFTTIAQAAEIAELSVPRFQHLFRDIVGTPFRRYRLWKRMANVAHSLSLGETLTNAALDAGFSSSAHLSSAFREMFGIKPSDLIALRTKFFVDEVLNDLQ